MNILLICMMMTWAQLGLQDATSPIMEELMFFHDFTMVVILFIMSGTTVVLGLVLFSPYIYSGLVESQMLECIWTLAPAVVLVQVAIPSLLLLYTLDESNSDSVSMKVVGHQWYWSYEYSDFWRSGVEVEFDSYLDRSLGLSEELRLLDTDSRAVLPYHAHIRVLVGAADVLHSWALPALGVKVDACPGRLNQLKLLSHRPGLFFGQCSEICGANHSFMPVAVEFVGAGDFLKWVSEDK